MPKITKEESDARRAEIIDACEALYRSESYHDITMTQIAAKVSFGRANVYNYFQNKDEILLALLQREHELWADDLASLRESGMTLEDESLADGIAASLEKRTQMLKLLAMNLYDIEQNSRLESLVAFKHAYKRQVSPTGTKRAQAASFSGSCRTRMASIPLSFTPTNSSQP